MKNSQYLDRPLRSVAEVEAERATPRPWFIFGAERWAGWWIRQAADRGGGGIADCDVGYMRSPSECRANAALIVRAVNAHDDLVAALRDLLAQIDKHPVPFNDVLPAVNRANAALAKIDAP